MKNKVGLRESMELVTSLRELDELLDEFRRYRFASPKVTRAVYKTYRRCADALVLNEKRAEVKRHNHRIEDQIKVAPTVQKLNELLEEFRNTEDAHIYQERSRDIHQAYRTRLDKLKKAILALP